MDVRMPDDPPQLDYGRSSEKKPSRAVDSVLVVVIGFAGWIGIVVAFVYVCWWTGYLLEH